MATSSFERRIKIKGKKAVNKFYNILISSPKVFIPKYDIEKELKRGIKILKRYYD